MAFISRLETAYNRGLITRKQIDLAIMNLPCFSLFGLRRGLEACETARQLAGLEKVTYEHPLEPYMANIQSKNCFRCPLIFPALNELTSLLPKR